MKSLKPFGDVPDKLATQIKRAFVASRTFHNGLKTSANVVKRMASIRLNSQCSEAVIKMQQCNLCNESCQNFCLKVVKDCFDFISEFDIEWNNFIIAMDKLAERLLGPFNIVMAIEPINIKISEAIMNFQESGKCFFLYNLIQDYTLYILILLLITILKFKKTILITLKIFQSILQIRNVIKDST